MPVRSSARISAPLLIVKVYASTYLPIKCKGGPAPVSSMFGVRHFI